MVALLLAWGDVWQAGVVALLLLLQLRLMVRLLASPRERAPWYNATGTSLYVLGMLVSAFALRERPGVAVAGGAAMSGAAGLGWLGIVRLGLVQACIGAVVVLATSTLNRVMVVELALPAIVPGRAGGAALRACRCCARAWATARTWAGGARRGSSAAWRRCAPAASARRPPRR